MVALNWIKAYFLEIKIGDLVMKKRNFVFLIAIFAVPLLFWSKESSAIPVFARKYQTSCYTCHSGFITRNAFGEAFRNNGYRWPGEDDEEFTKQAQMKIGSDAQKNVFPDAPWPADIPGFGPFAIWLRGTLANYSEQVRDKTGKVVTRQTLNWGAAGPLASASLFFGGTIGDQLSVLGVYDPLANAARGHFVWAFQPGLNLSVGNFFSDFSFGQAITTSNSVLPTDPGPNALGTGAELIYTLERMKFTVGITQAGTVTTATGVSSVTVANHFDDIRYLRVKYKFDGAGLLSGAGGTLGNEFVGLDNHIAIGASLVSLRPEIPKPTSTTTVLSAPHNQGETLIYEVDITGNYGNFTGGVAYSRDRDLGYDNFVIQTGYFIYPWLKATANYTSLQSGLNPNLAVGIGAWLRANASLTLTWTHPIREYVRTQAKPSATPSEGNTSVDTATLAVGFAF
ncbi:MAG: hypothetical protein HGB19_01425 [Chlorobiales bacterium]|nr:hypothetical protein [Chlorobiales bacterium]